MGGGGGGGDVMFMAAPPGGRAEQGVAPDADMAASPPSSHTLQEATRVRQEFPEAWIWADVFSKYILGSHDASQDTCDITLGIFSQAFHWRLDL